MQPFSAAIIAFLLLTGSTFAQTPNLADSARQSIVYIYFEVTDPKTGAKTAIQGTGFVVSDNGYVLTASHLFRAWRNQTDADKGNNSIQGTLRDKLGFVRESPLNLQVADPGDPDKEDVALLKLPDPVSAQTYPIARICFKEAKSSKLGEDLQAFGFPHNQSFQPLHATLGTQNAPGARWAAASAFAEGMSGGPVYNSNGFVIGIVKGGLDINAVNWITPIQHAASQLKMAGVEDCGGAPAPIGLLSTVKHTPGPPPCATVAGASSKADVFSKRILVSGLGDDKESHRLSLNLKEAIENQPGLPRKEMSVQLVAEPVEDDEEGRKLLSACHADLLVWGRVTSPSGAPKTQVGLHFVLSEGEFPYDDEGLKPNSAFALSEELTLNADISSKLIGPVYLPIIQAILSDPNSDKRRVEEAIKKFSDFDNLAQKPPLGQERYLWKWAGTINDLIGYKQNNPQRFEKAAGYWDTLSKNPGPGNKLAEASQNLGVSYFRAGILYDQEKKKDKAKEAYERSIKAYVQSLNVFKEDTNLPSWSDSKFGLGTARALLFVDTGNEQLLVDAEKDLKDAIDGYARAGNAANQALAQKRLGIVLYQKTDDKARLERSVKSFDDALSYYTVERSAEDWAVLQSHLGFAFRLRASAEEDRKYLKESRGYYKQAANLYSTVGKTAEWAKAMKELGDAYYYWCIRPTDKPQWDIKSDWYDLEAFKDAINAYGEALKIYGSETKKEKTDIESNLASLLYAYGFGKGNAGWLTNARQISEDLKDVTGDTASCAPCTLRKVGAAEIRANDPAGAMKVYEEELAIARMRADTDQSKPELVWLALKHLGRAKLRNNMAAAAFADYNEGLNLASKLASTEQKDSTWRQYDWESHVYSGNAKIVSGDAPGALVYYGQALDRGRTLVKAYPNDTGIEWSLMWTLEKQSNALFIAGKKDNAFAAARDRSAESKKLASKDKNKEDWQFNLAEGLFRLALAQTMAGSSIPNTAQEKFKTFVVLDLVDNPDTMPARSELAVSIFRLTPKLSIFKFVLNRGVDARDNLSSALDILRGLDRDNKLTVDQKAWIALVSNALDATADRQASQRHD